MRRGSDPKDFLCSIHNCLLVHLKVICLVIIYFITRIYDLLDTIPLRDSI